ncbi:MAG: hypothetical protein NUV51_09430 [Sulfuricaulis sp.]|nr:hypothetical protein [Sulfuricaulis sp.]
MIIQQQADEIIHRAMRDGATRIVEVCAWCPDARAKMEEAHRDGCEVTHGMCPACVLKFEER